MIRPTQLAVFHTATTAWARWCMQQRLPYRHPSAQWSTIGSRYVHLKDAQGWALARYDHQQGRIVV